MVGQLRTHPELRGTQSMTHDQKAISGIVAIREYFNVGQPVDQDEDHRRPGGNLLVFEKLRDMVCWILMMRQYGYTARIVRGRHLIAMEDGGVWFVRWVTDHMIDFLTSGEVSSYVWASYVLMHLSEVMEEMERLTTEIDNEIRQEEMVEVEAERFNEMVGRLEQIFKYTQESLQTTRDSDVGIDELLRIVNESDIVCMLTGPNLRLTWANMRRGQRWKRHECFKNISEQLITRLKERKYSLPVDNAVRIMLKVIPRLGEHTLNRIPLRDWYDTLTRYGFAVNAETLAAAIDNEGSLQSGSVTPVSVTSHSLRTPGPILPLDPRPLPLETYGTPTKTSDEEEGDDDDEEEPEQRDVQPSASPLVYPPLGAEQAAPPTSDEEEDDDDEDDLEWNNVRLSASPLAHRTPDVGQTASTSPGAGSLRTPGLPNTHSARNSVREPSSDVIDFDSLEQSTPRPAKKARMSVEAEGSNDSGPSVQLTPRPMRRSPMNMGGLGSALVDFQTGDDNALGAGIVVPTIEWPEPVTQSSPHGSSDEDHFEAAAALENDRDVTPTAKNQSRGNPTKWQDLYAEYIAFPRRLRIYDRVELKLVNADRLWVLEILGRAEARGKVCQFDKLNNEDRKEMYEAIDHDMEAIRTLVRDTSERKDRSGPFQSLRSLIDFDESDGSVGTAWQRKVPPGKTARKIFDRKREKIDRMNSETKISGRRMMISEAVARRKEMENA